MAAVTKITQLDLFIKERKDLNLKVKEESDRSLKSQIRLLLHTTHEMKIRQEKQEAIIQELIDYILEEKPPEMPQGENQGAPRTSSTYHEVSISR